MHRIGRAGVVIVIALLVAVGAGAPVATGSHGYDLTVPGSLETPPRSFSIAGGTYTVSAIGRTDPGGSFTVEAAVPPNTTYRVIVYDADQNVVDHQPGSTDGTFDFSAPNPPYEPGSYAISLFADGVHQRLHPLLVRGFDVTVEAPSSAESDETIDVTVDVTRTAGTKPIHSVEVAIVDSDDTIRETASKVADGTYEASIALDGLEPGTYRIYATVNGEEEAFDRKERLGISDASSLSVTEPSAGGGGGGGGGGGFAAPSTSPTPSPSTTATDTEGTTESLGSTPTTVPPTATESGRAESDEVPSGSTEAGTETGEVITPRASPTPAVEDRQQPSIPLSGFGALPALVALALSAMVLSRRGRT